MDGLGVQSSSAVLSTALALGAFSLEESRFCSRSAVVTDSIFRLARRVHAHTTLHDDQFLNPPRPKTVSIFRKPQGRRRAGAPAGGVFPRNSMARWHPYIHPRPVKGGSSMCKGGRKGWKKQVETVRVAGSQLGKRGTCQEKSKAAKLAASGV